MSKDPLKIIGKPNPTPEERAAAEALSKQSGRPPKLCRAALLEANHDVGRASALLNDGKFLLWNAETDDLEMMSLAQRLMREQSGSPPDPHAATIDFSAVQKGYAAVEAYDQQARKARGKKLKDPVLGLLKWDTFWHGKLDVPGFGKLPLTVETDRDDDLATPPGDSHYKAVLRFTAESEKLRPKIEKANFAYYKRVRPNYDDGIGKPPPVVSKSSDLWKELRTPAVHVPLQDGKSWRVELTWNCSWDEEHGHAVYIEGGKVVNVSIQGDDFEPA